MATEALLTDQTAEAHVDEVKVTDDIKNVDGQRSSQPKDVEGKDEEEKLELEDSVGAGESVPEPEEKTEDEKSGVVVEEVKKEEAEEAKASASDIIAGDAEEKEEITEQESDPSSAVEPAVEVAEKELENQVAVTDTSEPSKESVVKSAEVLEESLVQASRSAATDSEAVTEEFKTAEIPDVLSVSEVKGKPVETSIESSIAEPEASDITTPDVSESVEIPGDGDENISAKELLVSHESSKEGTDVAGSSKPEEASEKVQEPVVSESSDAVAIEPTAADEIKEIVERVVPTAADEIKEIVERVVVPEEIPDAQEKKEANQTAEKSAKEENGSDAVDTSLATEGLVKPGCKVEEENQGKVVVVEEPIISQPTKTDAASEVAVDTSEVSGDVEKVEEKSGSQEGLVETSKDLDDSAEVAQISSEVEKVSGGVEVVNEKKDGSLEGDNTKVVETAKDLGVEGGKNDSDGSTENTNENSGDNKEETGKTDEQNLVEPAKDGNEGPKEEAPAKPSQRQSHSIMSKVKQSLVKVKKAIIGKSPSSKTMTTENKDDIKV